MVYMMVKMMSSLRSQLQCFGSSSHLKNKFGQGFTLLTKIPATGEIEEEYMYAYDGDGEPEDAYEAKGSTTIKKSLFIWALPK